MLGVAEHLLGRHDAELAALRQAVAISPRFLEGRVARALALCEVERLASCEEDLDALLAEGSLTGEARLLARTEAALRRGDFRLAEARLGPLRAGWPSDPRVAKLTSVAAAQRARAESGQREAPTR
jgi:hypothetical protein